MLCSFNVALCGGPARRLQFVLGKKFEACRCDKSRASPGKAPSLGKYILRRKCLQFPAFVCSNPFLYLSIPRSLDIGKRRFPKRLEQYVGKPGAFFRR